MYIYPEFKATIIRDFFIEYQIPYLANPEPGTTGCLIETETGLAAILKLRTVCYA